MRFTLDYILARIGYILENKIYTSSKCYNPKPMCYLRNASFHYR